MSTFSNVSPLPIPETVKHKTDNLDWENMPSDACDLNYPVPITVTWKDHFHIVAQCLLVSAILPPAAALFGTLVAGRLMNRYWGIGAALLGICMFAYHHRGRLQDSDEGCPPLWSWTSLGFLIGPAFLWLAVILTGRLNEPVGAFWYYVLIATPMVFLLSDLIATHAVYWLSAGLYLDHDTFLSWRNDWDRRFLDDPALSPAFHDLQEKRNSASHEAACRTRYNYFLNVFCIFGATLAPGLLLMVVVQEPRRETIGLQILCGVILGVMLVAWIRLQGRWRMATHLKSVFTHWLHYGNQGPVPPWVFQSPCGSLWFRRFITVATIGCLAIAISSLAFGPTIQLISTLYLPAANVSQSESNNTHITPERSTAEILGTFTPMQWILFGVSMLCGLIVPPVILFAGTLVVIGPIVHTYTEALTVEGA